MRDAIIVLNAGSSSLKFSVYAVHPQERQSQDEQLEVVVKGQIEGLGTSPRFKAKDASGKVLAETSPASEGRKFGHPQAFAYLADWIREQFRSSLAPIAVGHRVVHGGLDYGKPTVITPEVMQKLEQLVPLVPLHQPHNLNGIRAVLELNSTIPQVACFDTAFHRCRAEVTERLGLPDEYFRKGVRRWGFHGLSYDSISSEFRKLAPDVASGRVIVAHLGSGSSMCAMLNGKCVDTTMGFSALDGLPMGTRCGSLDPGAVLFLMQDMSARQIEDMLYKRCGLLGISGVSNDVRALLESKEPLAAKAMEYFVYRAVREIGSLTAALNGLDALIFTAGIGENSPVIRERICRGLGWLGINISDDANQRAQLCITPKGSKPSVWVIPTDEEGVIARQTRQAIAELPAATA